MSEEKKNLAEVETQDTENDASSWFSLPNLFSVLVLNWQWFALTVFICLCGALIYLRYTDKVYSVSARMLVKDDDSRYRRNTTKLANMQDLGFITNSTGIENEVEIMQSRILARDAVKELKLYSTYYTKGKVKDHLAYGKAPIFVDIDPMSLDSMDIVLLEEMRNIKMSIYEDDGTYSVDGVLLKNGKTFDEFSHQITSLPDTLSTGYGTLVFTQNPAVNEIKIPTKEIVTINPPMVVATRFLRNLTVAPLNKQSSIAEISLKDIDPRRGIDFVRTLIDCYNQQANADKNEIALKTEEFINDRIRKINDELGTTETELQSYKERHSVTELSMDASQSLKMLNDYAVKLAEASSQIQLLDYLREFVDNPANQYKIIPSNVGMTDQASTALITSFNQTVQERNRLLKVASEQAPQILALTSTLDDLQGSIRSALLQARRTADIQRQSLQAQYSKYQNRVGNSPEQERILTQIGRQQEVKSGLYLMLLEKREENSISLAATADKGKLIDEPNLDGLVSPKRAIILLAAVVLGFALPLLVLFVLSLFRYRVEGHDDLARLTQLPLVGDIPVASDKVKGLAGIVVQANKNNQIDEVFRSLRTNVQFMLKEGEKVILLTSSTSGEGKTFLAANLAVSFALLGKKVIICGMDIRKPALGKLFELKDTSKGISTLLVKAQVTADDVHANIQSSGVNANLNLMLAGPIPPNPAELLTRQNLGDIIDILKQEYDYVILDTAPVGLVTDTLQIVKYANICCYVVRADYTPKSDIWMLNSLANEGKIPNPCVIMNGVDMSKKKYGYYYGYGKYGHYGRYGYGRYGYGKYGRYGYGNYGNYGNYGHYADSHYSNKDDDSIKR